MEFVNYSAKIIDQYHENAAIYRSMVHDINDIFSRIIKKNHFRISNYAVRIKTEDSLKRKIEFKNKYHDINDIKNGKQIYLNCDEEIVMIVENQTIIAAYAKEKDGIYVSRRGLW